jgi:SAM-dependent methyltransferase
VTGRLDACRGCGSPDLHQVLSLGDQPPANALTSAPDEPVTARPLDLLLCTACALVQLGVTVDPDELFLDYPYFSSFSPTVEANAAALVAQVVRERGLGPADLAVEVASNDGYLLRNYLPAGVRVLGVDPARNVAPAAEAAGVRTVTEFFTRDLAEHLAAEQPASVVHANNVLAHVPDVNDLVAGIAAILAPDGVAIIETPSLQELVGRLEYDTIYHEHVYYYSATAVRTLFARHGLDLVRVERIPIHGGSLRLYAMRSGAAPADASVGRVLAEEAEAGVAGLSYFADFAARVDDLRARQRAFIDEVLGRGASLAGYGAAAKATVMLHAIGASVTEVAFVADRSPHKQGRYLPGTGIPIVAPEVLTERAPDYTLLFVWNFADEVIAQCADYRRAGGRFVVPVPDVRVVEPL